MTLLKVSFSIMITITCGRSRDAGAAAGADGRTTRLGAGGCDVRGRVAGGRAAEVAVPVVGGVGDDVVGGDVGSVVGGVVVVAAAPRFATDVGGAVGGKAR